MTRILVVDDDRTQAEEFEVLLRQAGCDVTLAGNGREALDFIRNDAPDVVLTDLDMSEMDGLELVQAIRRDYPALPVILMTAMGSEEIAAKALVNAIQHGNLELNSELRQEGEQAFAELCEERRRQPPYRDRRVRMRATLSRSAAVYIVEDEGPGFDSATLPVSTEPANLERVGGRGLTLIRAFMDEVEYNEKGNRITLRRRNPSAAR